MRSTNGNNCPAATNSAVVELSVFSFCFTLMLIGHPQPTLIGHPQPPPNLPEPPV